MANYSISISNSLNSFGPAPCTKWGSGTPYSMTWGASKWGEGTEDLIIEFMKLLSNSLVSDSAIANATEKLVVNNLAATSETTNEGLSDGSGYLYVFPAPTTEAENRSMPSYTQASASITSFTSGAVPVTVWSG